MATSLAIAILFPASFPFLWNPIKMNREYYSSLRPLPPELLELAASVKDSVPRDQAILASSESSELLSVLTGNPVYFAERVFARSEARRRRKTIRALLRASSSSELLNMLDTMGIGAIVADGAFRWEHGRVPHEWWSSSGIFARQRTIGGRYILYVVRR